MNTSNHQAYLARIRQVPGDLFQLDEKPLLGFPPDFPWSEFSSNLGRSLQINELSIKPGEWKWIAHEELLTGLGNSAKALQLTVTPLSGQLWWAMPQEEIARLMGFILAKQPASSSTLDEDFFNAFYRFLAIEAINAFEKSSKDKKISPTLSAEEELPKGHCLCLDITINIPQGIFYGRLFLSPEFRNVWKQRYIQQQSSLNLASPIAETLDVIVHLEGGRIKLKPSEWKQIVPGDVLLLDHCTLDPDEDKGRVMLVINDVPFFRAKIKQGSLKILEHPLYHEVDTAMNNSSKNDEDPHDDEEMEDDDFDLDDDEELEDFDIEDEEMSDSDFELDEIEETPAPKEASTPPPPSKPSAEAPASQTQAQGKAPLAIDDIPLPVIIEVGRIQMSIKKLLELQPGNMLELNIHPEAGIDLVVNGKRIARGELLRIGEALGIRIIELV